jgi:hypothetical protein
MQYGRVNPQEVLRDGDGMSAPLRISFRWECNGSGARDQANRISNKISRRPELNAAEE